MNSSQSSNGIRTSLIIFVIASIIGEVLYIVFTPILAANGAIPATASERLDQAYLIMYIFTIAAIPVFMFVVVFCGYAIARWRTRGRPTEDGPAISGNSRLQLAWIVIAIALAGFLYVVGFQGLAEIEAASPSNAVHIRVTGEQWLWDYTYTDPKYRANGGPGVGSTVLELPINTPIQFTVTSIDVQHSFWLPELGVKEDAVPGELNTATVTADKLGTYQVRCMELCGVYHSYMNTLAKVVSVSEFNDWVSSQPQAPASYGVQNLASQSLPPMALVGVGKQS